MHTLEKAKLYSIFDYFVSCTVYSKDSEIL